MIIRSLNKTNVDARFEGPHVVLSGTDPSQGFMIWGPFPTRRAAKDWLETACDDNGWVVQLESPNEGS